MSCVKLKKLSGSTCHNRDLYRWKFELAWDISFLLIFAYRSVCIFNYNYRRQKGQRTFKDIFLRILIFHKRKKEKNVNSFSKKTTFRFISASTTYTVYMYNCQLKYRIDYRLYKPLSFMDEQSVLNDI
jgi:hypothetical protein